MWEDAQYCWVVFCKNYIYHIRKNLFHRHRIPLGITDAVASRPVIDARFSVRCDDCAKEYLYAPSEVLRYEQEPPDNFQPHPLFREEEEIPAESAAKDTEEPDADEDTKKRSAGA